jgi:two-component system, response regulator YesN
MRFLLVEDEYYARKALRQSVLLWQQSAYVAEAENGVHALSMLEQSSFDVVLMDIRMPQMDGLTLAEHIAKRFSDTYMIMITGYSEFEYAQTAIRMSVREYLLKPVDDDKLCDALTRAQEYWEQKRRLSAEEQALRSDGKCMRRQLSLSRLQMWLSGQAADWEPDEPFESCMAFRVYGFTAPNHRVENELQTRLSALGSMRCDTFPVRSNDLCVFVRYRGSGPDRKARLEMLDQLQKAMSYCGMETCMAMGGLNSAKDGPHAYEQAQIAQNYRLLRNESIVCYGNLKEQAVYISEPGPKDISEFSICLSQGKAEQAAALARQAVQVVIKTKNVSLAALQDTLNRLCACMNCAIAKDVSENGAMDAELLQVEIKADDFLSPAALIARLNVLIVKVCALKERVAVSNADQVVDYLKQYVGERFGENIALKELAESRLYLNPSYLSRLFKAKTGISFKNYLTQVRMDHACSMLLSREQSVMNIAGECGYADASQFIQLFRKHFGMTPSVYRETQAGYKTDIWLDKR